MSNTNQPTIERAFEKDYPEDGNEFVGSMYDVYRSGFEAGAKNAELMDKELTILHELVTELYNIEICVAAIRLTLSRIKKVHDGK